MSLLLWVLAVGVLLAALNICVLYAITRDLRHRVEALETKSTRTDEGICGDESPAAVGPGAVMVCDLPWGHASEWHSGDRPGQQPMLWRNRGLSPRPDPGLEDPGMPESGARR